MKNCWTHTLDFKGSGYDLLKAFTDEKNLFLLDSQMGRSTGRFSFFGFSPFAIFEDKGSDFLPRLKKMFQRYPSVICPSTPFPGGVVGYLSYDLGLYLEEVPVLSTDDLLLPDGFFGFYDCVLTIDHVRKKLIVSATGLPEQKTLDRKKRAEAKIKKLVGRLQDIPVRSQNSETARLYVEDRIGARLKSNFSKAGYLRAVKRILEMIRRGDLYQTNLSQRFEISKKLERPEIIELYGHLSSLSPTDFSAFLDCGEFQILSSSPERLIHLKDRTVETRPMKGTRSRGANLIDDQKQRRELLKSPKDQAELLMITDLERNDLGRVCDFGSVKVKQMRTLEEYRTVFQTTSTVTGRLRKDRDAFDVIRACFPGGSVTGCPKIRAMQAIEELEPTRRGIYTGALGYLSFSGEMDFNILIRSLLCRRGKIYFQAGGGIVADSDPLNEYHETLVKAKALALACGI